MFGSRSQIRSSTFHLQQNSIHSCRFNDPHTTLVPLGGALFPISEFLVPFGFRFVASYPDYMELGSELHVCANALFVLPFKVSTEAML